VSIEAALDDSSSTVRENACAIAGNAEAPVSVEKLRKLRESDPEESIRERAAWAISRLS
jgi:HEAT repeat protein